MHPDIRHLFTGTRIAKRRRRATPALAAAALVAGMLGATGLAASPAWAARSLAVKTASLPAGPEGAVYRAKLAAVGGTGPYTWSITAGTLPAGLTLVPATGLITGIPSLQAPVDDQFAVQVSDSETPAATATAKLSIQTELPPPLELTTTTFLPPATADAPYSQKLATTGGTAPYTWSVTSGKLPAGLTLQPGTGVISGSPKAGGTFVFTVRVRCAVYGKAAAAGVATEQLSLTVNVASLAITTVPPLPAARPGLPYSVKLGAAGGITPFTWSVKAGLLPPGLKLHPATGVISGTPVGSGTYIFTVGVTDSQTPAQAAGVTGTLTVLSPVKITETSLPAAVVGSPYTAQLSASGGVAPYTWSLIDGSQLPAGLSLSPDGTITGVPEEGGSASFTVQAADAENPPMTSSDILTIPVGYNIQG